jgi:hypothetical protein
MLIGIVTPESRARGRVLTLGGEIVYDGHVLDQVGRP